jgi:HEAT repeat protein
VNTGGKRWCKAFPIAAGILLTLAIWHFAGDRGPKYMGRTVSYWFDEYCRSGQFMRYEEMRHEDAMDALRHLGTNAVPYLLEETFDTNLDSPARSNYIGFIQSLPRSWGVRVPVAALARLYEGQQALQEIKPPAKPIFPFLESQYRITNSPPNFSRRQAILVMGGLGDGAEMAVPDLVAALHDPDPWAQVLALESLDWLGPKATDAVPALVSYMESNTTHAASAVRALGSIGVNDPEAVRLIRQKFKVETYWNSRCQEAAALCRMDAGQTDALNFLVVEWKTNHSAGNLWYLARMLGQVGTNAQAAVPVLMEVLKAPENSTNVETWTSAAQALQAIGVPSPTLLEEMRPALHAKDETLRVNAAAQIMAIDPADHDAHQVLMKAIQDNPALLGRYAMETLAKAGPAAREAIPALKEAAKSEEPDVAEAAKIALRRIEENEEGK